MTDVSKEKLDRFFALYTQMLDNATRSHPEEYALVVRTGVEEVSRRMRIAVERGSWNHDGRAFKATCKALGIKHTRKAIKAFLFDGEDTEPA